MITAPEDFNIDIIKNLPVLPSGKKKPKLEYLNIVTAFDIETTLIKKYKQSIMYVWQFQIADHTIIGRTWDQFRDLIKQINEAIPDGCMMVCYVHNLSYEWQFIRTIIPVDSVFAMDKRKILKFTSGKIEFRCSYLHSNMSLDRFTRLMGVKNKKVHGFDYSKQRFPWTPLNDFEMEYISNDVIGLVQAIETEMQRDGDDLYTIPLTSTGYARRDAKDALRWAQRWIRSILPDLEVLIGLHKAFRGGNTHANRHYAGLLLDAAEFGGIFSDDISSSYPATLETERFPMAFTEADPDLMRLYLKHDKALLMHVILHDVKLKNDLWGCPYISEAKCERCSGVIKDNGRVLSAQHLEMWITEIDFRIIASEYDFSYEIIKMWQAQKRRLPKTFRELIMKQYTEKTTLKGVDDYLYQKKKNKFNANFGMMVQWVLKAMLIYEDGEIREDAMQSQEDLLEEYHRKGWLPYQWGVWCTAYARLKLEEGMQAIPPEDFLYCDTDSIKHLNDHTKELGEVNAKYKREELSAVDPEGNRHYLGIFEPDGEYRMFKTLGAKKYCYVDMDGKLHLTCSGVHKTKGAEELGRIENFEPGFVFREAGGTESRYNDIPQPSRIRIQGHDLEITPNIAIIDSTYHLGLSEDYHKLLLYLSNMDLETML